MPIKGLTDELRMPRLGKIHLGLKEKNERGNEYPSATDYFVCPPEVLEALGSDRPAELTIMFPTEEPDQFAQAYYKAFSRTRGLVCKGDGNTADRTVNMAAALGPDGVLPDVPNDAAHWPIAPRETEAKDLGRHVITCEGQGCPQYISKACRRMMMLQFMLPGVPGLGIYQIDTGSRNSILNIYGGLELIRSVVGRVSMIPLTLKLGPIQTVSPDTGRAQTNNVMTLSCDFSMDSVKSYRQLGPVPDMNTKQLPEPDDEVPDDLVPGGGTDDTEGVQGSQEAAAQADAPAPAPARTPEPVQAPVSPPETPSEDKVEPPARVRKLTEQARAKLLDEIRATGCSQDEYKAAYKALGLQEWVNLNTRDRAVLQGWIAEYQAATLAAISEASGPAVDAGPPDLDPAGAPVPEQPGGDAPAEDMPGMIEAFRARAAMHHVTEDTLLGVMAAFDIPGWANMHRTELDRLTAWLEPFEDDEHTGLEDVQNEQQATVDGTGGETGWETPTGQVAPAASVAPAAAEGRADDAPGGAGPGPAAALDSDGQYLEALNHAELVLGVEFETRKGFEAAVLGMPWGDFLKMGGGFNESYKRRVARIKDRAASA